MSTYAIGDVQGCAESLYRLLEKFSFNQTRDRLWFVGDLVNRGPASLQVLRFVKGLGESAITVLGNHDLHLLCVAAGYTKPHRHDTLEEILAAPDREELLDWLRRLPLMHYERGIALVHAGLLPGWPIADALKLAAEVQAALRGPEYRLFLAKMYGNLPSAWQGSLAGFDRLRVITNAMTRLRVCTLAGDMEFDHKAAPEAAPPGYLPWYDIPDRCSKDTTIVFGHWSALGLKVRDDLLALDTGCLWGGQLTAVRLEDRTIFQVACEASAGTTMD